MQDINFHINFLELGYSQTRRGMLERTCETYVQKISKTLKRVKLTNAIRE